MLQVRLALCSMLALASVCVQAGSLQPVMLSKWGIKLDIPSPLEKHEVPVQGDEVSSEAYVQGRFVYIVKVTNAPQDALVSTEIERVIQSEMKAAANQKPAPKRWEIDLAGEELIKGYTRIIQLDGRTVASAPFLAKAMGGKTAILSLAMTPLDAESSQVLSVGVMGPVDASSDTRKRAEQFALSIKRFPKQPEVAQAPEPVKVPPVIATPPQPALRPAKPVVQAPKPKQPKAIVKVIPPLKKGQIELSGAVMSVDWLAKSLNMSVDSVTLPGTKPVAVSGRTKLVLLDRIPEGIAQGSRITVIGKNDGVGVPIKADYLDVKSAAPKGNS
ncbi:MAG: hypothetical protein ABFD54_01175 [Armatimonadota bacterium]|nr:hypothetical protein [bacterium]